MGSGPATNIIKGVVFVGDRFQMLYKWRGATNVIDLLENAKEYRLTTSFRVSQNDHEKHQFLQKNYGFSPIFSLKQVVFSPFFS